MGQGLDEPREYAARLWSAGLSVTDHHGRLTYLDCGSKLIIKGTTFGHDKIGLSWDGGSTPGGRFCSVFGFDDQGLIHRMYDYMDPGYTGADSDRSHWNRVKPRW